MIFQSYWSPARHSRPGARGRGRERGGGGQQIGRAEPRAGADAGGAKARAGAGGTKARTLGWGGLWVKSPKSERMI